MPSERETHKSDRILSEIRLRREREKIQDVDEPAEQFVIFSLSGDLYALAGREVLEILPEEEIHPIPGAPPCIPGLITVRGEIESVLDLRAVLGLPARREGKGLILLASGGHVRSGILIDTVEDVADVPHSSILPPPTTLGNGVREYVCGHLERGGRNVVLLDPARIFGSAAVA
ncbi:MAG: purine-binding chemotaxis protein CheW [Geobacteraceae bacterium]|nr:purine-binding chemotaxis protein CheW [Geobacteraceae bacterium]